MEMKRIGFLDSKGKIVKYFTTHADLVSLNINIKSAKVQSSHSYHQNFCHISGKIQ
jgi:hypothetical protein